MTKNAHQIEATFESWASLASQLALPALRRWRVIGNDSSAAPSSHGTDADRLEAFTRPLLLASLASASGDPEICLQTRNELSEGIHAGLLANSKFSWPRPHYNSQAIPEAASLAISLWVNDHALWRTLDDQTAAALIEWFRECARASEPRLNNWRLFGVLLAKFLESVGVSEKSLRQTADKGLRSIEDWYDDCGWYSDGSGRTYDYYNSFAFHFYPPLIAFLSNDEHLRRKYASRLQKYLDDLKWLIGPDGAPVFFGRSLTYRFAIAAPFAIAPLVGADSANRGDLDTATTCVNYFLRNGLIDSKGLVGRGWHAQDRTTAQVYSGELASYWFAKSFTHLLTPRDAAYWNKTIPSSSPEGVHLVKAPGFLVSRQIDARPVIMINQGSYDRTATDLRLTAEEPQYSRIEYSSITAPTGNSTELTNAATLKSKHGRKIYSRSRPIRVNSNNNWIFGEWEMRAKKIRVEGEGREHSMLSKLARHIRRMRPVATSLREFRPKISMSSGFLGEWSVHALTLKGRLPIRSTLTFSGWGIDSPDPNLSPGSNFAQKIGKGYSSVLVGIKGWEAEGSTNVLDGTAFADNPVAPFLSSPAAYGKLYVVATGIMVNKKYNKPNFELDFCSEKKIITIRQRQQPGILHLPYPSDVTGANLG